MGQTPKWVLREFGPFWGALAWGLDLGQGWTTRIESAGYFALVGWALLAGGPAHGAVALGAFGAGRAAPVFAAGPLATRVDLGPLAVAYMRRTTSIRRFIALALAVVAGYLLSVPLDELHALLG